MQLLAEGNRPNTPIWEWFTSWEEWPGKKSRHLMVRDPCSRCPNSTCRYSCSCHCAVTQGFWTGQNSRWRLCGMTVKDHGLMPPLTNTALVVYLFIGDTDKVLASTPEEHLQSSCRDFINLKLHPLQQKTELSGYTWAGEPALFLASINSPEYHITGSHKCEDVQLI